MRSAIIGSLLSLLSVSALAQPPSTVIIARDGWEAFPGVEYQGGDATQPKKLWGMLVLTDSTVALHRCATPTCGDNKKGQLPFRPEALFTIALSTVKQITSSSQVRGADAMGKVMLGMLASDRPEEFVALVYETASSVEAPVFKTGKAHSTALDAKLRFRLKKLGIELPDK